MLGLVAMSEIDITAVFQDFKNQIEEEELTQGQRDTIDRAVEGMMAMFRAGDDLSSVAHAVLGVLAAVVMKSAEEDEELHAKAAVLEIFADYLSTHVTKKTNKDGVLYAPGMN